MASQPDSSGTGTEALQKAIELGRVGLAKTVAEMRTLEPPSKQDFGQARPSNCWANVQYYIFNSDPAVEGLRGYLMSTLETVALMQASSLEHPKEDDSRRSPKTGYPWIRESSDDAGSEDAAVRKVMLDVDDPSKIISVLLNYIRGRVKGDFGAEDSNIVLCNKHFNLDEMVTSLTAPSEAFTMWSFAMLDALRVLALSAWSNRRPPMIAFKRLSCKFAGFGAIVTDIFMKTDHEVQGQICIGIGGVWGTFTCVSGEITRVLKGEWGDCLCGRTILQICRITNMAHGGPLGPTMDFSDDEEACDGSGDGADVGVGEFVMHRNEDELENEPMVCPELVMDRPELVPPPPPVAEGEAEAWLPRGKSQARWLPKGQRVDIDLSEMYAGESGPVCEDYDAIDKEIGAFGRFFTDDIIRERLLRPTSQRAHIELGRQEPPKLLNRWVDISLGEMYSFLAILLNASLIKVPDIREYWSTTILQVPLIKSLMSCDRFRQIKHCFSVANPPAGKNAADRLAKTRHFLDAVREISQRNWVLGLDVGLDESQCLCAARNARCAHQAEKNKPIADYVEVIAAHEAKAGYCYAFKVDERLPAQNIKVLIADVLKQLPRKGEDDLAAEGQHRRVAMDRFYCGVDNAKLALEHGHFMYGTVRSDRGPQRTGIRDEQKERRLEDGEFYWRMADLPVPMTMYLWRDSVKDGVWFISTCHRDEDDEVRRRKAGSPTAMKKCPLCAKDYNNNMGACDQCNSLRSSYTVQLSHKRRWYMCLVYYGIDILIVNPCIWYKQVLMKRGEPVRARKLSQKKFRMAAIEQLIARAAVVGRGRTKGATREPKRRRLSATGGEIVRDHSVKRLVDVGKHFAVVTEKRANCKLCYLLDKKECQTVWVCNECDGPIPLCLNKKRNCFLAWHTTDS